MLRIFYLIFSVYLRDWISLLVGYAIEIMRRMSSYEVMSVVLMELDRKGQAEVSELSLSFIIYSGR